jgi:hypothetical protein
MNVHNTEGLLSSLRDWRVTQVAMNWFTLKTEIRWTKLKKRTEFAIYSFYSFAAEHAAREGTGRHKLQFLIPEYWHTRSAHNFIRTVSTSCWCGLSLYTIHSCSYPLVRYLSLHNPFTEPEIHPSIYPSSYRQRALGLSEDLGIMVYVDACTYLHLNNCQLLW